MRLKNVLYVYMPAAMQAHGRPSVVPAIRIPTTARAQPDSSAPYMWDRGPAQEQQVQAMDELVTSEASLQGLQM